MNRRKKYRLFIVCFLALDLLAIVLLGYQYLSRKIPDEIQVSGENEADVAEMLENPLVTFEEQWQFRRMEVIRCRADCWDVFRLKR